MLKTNILKIGIAVLLIVFCLHLNGRSIAGDCDDLEHSKGTPIITGDHSYPAGWLSTADPDIEYDTENSSETVDRNDSATISVIGNNAPFTWSVSGTGFTLDNAQTTGLTNTLNADATACGAATITVTGCNGTVATGYVRCTTGQWSAPQAGCSLTGTPDTSDNYALFAAFTKTQGKYKQTQRITESGGGTCADTDCSALCNSTQYSCIGCTECLDWTCTTRGWISNCPQSFCCAVIGGCGPWPDGAFCMCNIALYYQEWECVP